MEFRSISGYELPRFSGLTTFFRLPHHPDVSGADVAIVGVPFDGGTTLRPGARFGPRGVREASSMVLGYQLETRSAVFHDLKICDAGDVAVVPMDILQTYARIEARIDAILDAGALPV